MNINYSNFPIIAILIPFIMAFIIGLFKEKYLGIKKALVTIATGASLVIVLLMIIPIFGDNQILTYWLGNRTPVNGYAIGIGLEVDKLSLLVGIIIAVACFLSSIYSIKYMSKDDGLDKYYALFLLLTASMLGFVFTGDLFNMYVMLEIMTFAAIALTAFRTQKDKALEAGFKYLVIGGLGSSLILLGTILIYAQAHTLNIAQIAVILNGKGSSFTPVTILSLACLLVGYAVKAFMVPCHTWPPDAHMSAPSSISMLLSGVMSKTGVYGLIRILFVIFMLTGNVAISNLVVIWGAITMVVGVSMALLQSDFKRLLAFHSVSQLGYVIVGVGLGLMGTDSIANLGLAAGLYHMINHVTFKCLLFLCAGAILYRTGTTDLNKMSGLSRKMPFTTGAFLIGAAAISGIPPFNGFVSKWLIYQSSFDSRLSFVAIVSLVVSVLTLASFIKVCHSAFYGPEKEEFKDVKEVPLSMRIPMGILATLCILFGVFSNFMITKVLQPTVVSIRSIQSYVNNMLGIKDALNQFKSFSIDSVVLGIRGIYKPETFLIIFSMILLAILLFLTFSVNVAGNVKVENKERLSDEDETMYEVFTGGEKDQQAKLGPHDLFWGLKYTFRGYFDRISTAHSGVVNDYTLWVVAALALIILYCFITLM